MRRPSHLRRAILFGGTVVIALTAASAAMAVHPLHGHKSAPSPGPADASEQVPEIEPYPPGWQAYRPTLWNTHPVAPPVVEQPSRRLLKSHGYASGGSHPAGPIEFAADRCVEAPTLLPAPAPHTLEHLPLPRELKSESPYHQR